MDGSQRGRTNSTDLQEYARQRFKRQDLTVSGLEIPEAGKRLAE